MAETVTNEDLEKKQDEVAKLREALEAERLKASVNIQDQENKLRAAQLDAEAARLRAELVAAKEASKVSVAREGVQPLVQSAVEQMKAAEALASGKPVGGAPVDPPPPTDNSDDKSDTENKG